MKHHEEEAKINVVSNNKKRTWSDEWFSVCFEKLLTFSSCAFLLFWLLSLSLSPFWRLKVLEPFLQREIIRCIIKWSIFHHNFFFYLVQNWVRIALKTSSGKAHFILNNFISIRVRISSKKNRLSSRKKFVMENDVQPTSIAVRDLFASMLTEVSRDHK